MYIPNTFEMLSLLYFNHTWLFSLLGISGIGLVPFFTATELSLLLSKHTYDQPV
jgi:energy-converting hydrogenase Eha subunit H